MLEIASPGTPTMLTGYGPAVTAATSPTKPPATIATATRRVRSPSFQQ